MTAAKINGLDRVLRAFGEARKKDAINIAAGLDKCGGIILAKSLELVPRATGALASTGTKQTTGSGFGAQTVVGYGGVAADGCVVDYALFVHEDEEAVHAPPTTYRYLTKAITATRGTCTSVLQRQLKVDKP